MTATMTDRSLRLSAALLALLSVPAFAQAPAAQTSAAQVTGAQSVPIPRERVTLRCQDSYFRSVRENFLLADETYPRCTLRLRLALRERWPGARTFYVLPRVTASLYVKGGGRSNQNEGRWVPLAPIVNPGRDPLHRAVPAADYGAVELQTSFGQLATQAGGGHPDTVSAGGKLTVCAAPVSAGEDACKTFDVAARYRVYTR